MGDRLPGDAELGGRLGLGAAVVDEGDGLPCLLAAPFHDHGQSAEHRLRVASGPVVARQRIAARPDSQNERGHAGRAGDGMARA